MNWIFDLAAYGLGDSATILFYGLLLAHFADSYEESCMKLLRKYHHVEKGDIRND